MKKILVALFLVSILLLGCDAKNQSGQEDSQDGGQSIDLKTWEGIQAALDDPDSTFSCTFKGGKVTGKGLLKPDVFTKTFWLERQSTDLLNYLNPNVNVESVSTTLWKDGKNIAVDSKVKIGGATFTGRMIKKGDYEYTDANYIALLIFNPESSKESLNIAKTKLAKCLQHDQTKCVEERRAVQRLEWQSHCTGEAFKLLTQQCAWIKKTVSSNEEAQGPSEANLQKIKKLEDELKPLEEKFEEFKKAVSKTPDLILNMPASERLWSRADAGAYNNIKNALEAVPGYWEYKLGADQKAKSFLETLKQNVAKGVNFKCREGSVGSNAFVLGDGGQCFEEEFQATLNAYAKTVLFPAETPASGKEIICGFPKSPVSSP